MKKLSLPLVSLSFWVLGGASASPLDFSTGRSCTVVEVGSGNYLGTGSSNGVQIGDRASTADSTTTVPLSGFVDNSIINFYSPAGHVRRGTLWMYAASYPTQCTSSFVTYVSPYGVGGPYVISIRESGTDGGAEVLFQKAASGVTCPPPDIGDKLLIQLDCGRVEVK